DETPAVEEIHLHDELGREAHAREQWRHREIRLPAEPRTHRRDEVLDVTEHASLAPEVVEDHDCAARAYHAPHFAQHGDGIGDGGDHVGRHRFVELVVAEVHRGGIHHLERDAGHRQRLHAHGRATRRRTCAELSGKGWAAGGSTGGGKGGGWSPPANPAWRGGAVG